MLDLTSRPAAPEREHVYLRREYVTRSDIAHFVRRNASTIGRSILVSLAAAVLYVFLAQPLFTARVQLLIDPKLPQPLRESPSEPSYYLDSPQVDSQIAVLRSEGLALAVIKKLGLFEAPGFQAGRQSGLLAFLGRIFEGNENAVRSEDERNREAIAQFGVDSTYAVSVSPMPSISFILPAFPRRQRALLTPPQKLIFKAFSIRGRKPQRLAASG